MMVIDFIARLASMVRWLFAAVLALGALAGAAEARAQIGPPPATVYGSIADSERDIPAGVKIEAYIGDLLCGESKTEKIGEGAARVTVYAINVLADGDGQGAKRGCGKPGSEIRIKVGDRFAPRTVTWASGYPIRYDITFGNATPAPIPTFTPTPAATPTPPSGATPGGGSGGGPTAPGSPGASPTAHGGPGNASPAATGSPAAAATRPGGLASSTPALAGTEDDGGGFPVWTAVLGALGAVLLVGGVVGYALARRGADDETPGGEPPAPPAEF